jgi:hypothetical protein
MTRMIRFEEKREGYGQSNIDVDCHKSRRDRGSRASELEMTVSGSFRYPWIIDVGPKFMEYSAELPQSSVCRYFGTCAHS